MSLPENPESRLEQYLQNIATGEGEYPANPDSRLEQYLTYIIEHGGGGGSVPTPTAADAGKVPVANDQGGYTLGEKADNPTIVTSGTAIMLANNTIYNLSDVTTLDITFPRPVRIMRTSTSPLRHLERSRSRCRPVRCLLARSRRLQLVRRGNWTSPTARFALVRR